MRTNQRHLHPNLAAVVRRHLATAHRAVVAAHNRAAYAQLTQARKKYARPLVLDSFCGTGHSTALLAERHPEHFIVGIDKSAQRIAKHPSRKHDNYLLLQADCEDIWRLLVEEGLRADFHYLLYPNPWPKAAHLKRRLHGHPDFPLLLQLGGELELRSNWQLYVAEFASAMALANQSGTVSNLPNTGTALSLFEKKYHSSGHPIWAYRTSITP